MQIQPEVRILQFDPFVPRPISWTAHPMHLAIGGGGFFLVRMDDRIYATRAGKFQLRRGHIFSGTENFIKVNDAAVVNESGFHLQGLNDPGRTTWGDIRIDTQWDPSDPAGRFLRSFYINSYGEIIVQPEQGEPFIRGQIVLQYFRRPELLTPVGDSLYTGFEAAEPLDVPEEPPEFPSVVAVGYCGNRFASMRPLSMHGFISSGALEDIKPHSAHWVVLAVTGTEFSQIAVEASTDLLNWEEIGRVPGRGGGWSWHCDERVVDKNATSLRQRFYRARELVNN